MGRLDFLPMSHGEFLADYMHELRLLPFAHGRYRAWPRRARPHVAYSRGFIYRARLIADIHISSQAEMGPRPKPLISAKLSRRFGAKWLFVLPSFSSMMNEPAPHSWQAE